jgi:hypothetical protein
VPGQQIDIMDVPMMIGLLVFATLIVLGGFVLLFVSLTRGRREARVVHCPSARTRAVVLVDRREDGGGEQVVYCSRWSIGHDLDCDRACLRRAA